MPVEKLHMGIPGERKLRFAPLHAQYIVDRS